jgi:predicted N-acetyltransferase YhbS
VPLTVRDILPDEHPALAELSAGRHRGDGGSSAADQPLPRDAAAPTVLVAVDGDQLLGAVTLATRGGGQGSRGEAVVRMLVVSPPSRGRGTGELLLRAGVDRARADGCHLVRLSSPPASAAGHDLYARLGFARVPAQDRSPEPGRELLAYALALVPWCDQCGEPLTAQGHERCRRGRDLDPPRWCAHCRRRMVVQVTPTGWTARCVEHGERAA